MRATNHLRLFILSALITAVGISCSAASPVTATPKPATDLPAPKEDEKTRTAVFGMGCFWCAEAAFEQLKGVNEVAPGYAGGGKEHTTCETYANSNNAEAVKITCDPHQITYAQLLQILFTVGDATTKDG